MAWKENTAQKYNDLVENLGGKIIKQTNAQGALVLMGCGHERIFQMTSLSQGKQTLRCKVCWAQDKIQEHKQAINQLEQVTN